MTRFKQSITRTALLTPLALFALSFSLAAQQPPSYKVDPSWPKPLPNSWVIGQVSGLAADHQGHIWVLQRPKSVNKEDADASQSPARSGCCVPAPPVLEFDAQGNLLKSWGGAGDGYDWPVSEHSIFVDQEENVWITGNGVTDRQALKFTKDGKFILQIGHPSKAPFDSSDTSILGRPAGIEVDERMHEVYIADGYGNHRVIVFDSNTGAFNRMWGAYGHAPEDTDPGPYAPDAPPDQQFRNPVHCVHISNDRFVYVCDRTNDRIQMFTKSGKFLKEFFIHPTTLGNGSAYDFVFSHDEGQKYLLVADGEDDAIWTIRRNDGTVIGSFGQMGHDPGQFSHLHDIVMDPSGNLYTGEVQDGKRVQKFILSRRPESSAETELHRPRP